MDMEHGGNVWEEGDPGQWLDFSANLRPEGTPDWVMHTVRAALADIRYYPDRAMRAARKGLAAYACVREDAVLPTAGGAAAIDLALSRQTGTVHVLPVTFGEYAQRAAAHGRPVCVWRGSCKAGDSVVLCNPNNPTGQALGRERVLSLLEGVRASGGELIVDEAFIDYCVHHSVRAHVQAGLTVVGSLTKTMCIPGVRLGYVCAEPKQIAELERRAMPWALSTLASAVAAQLPQHLEQIRADEAQNAARAQAFKEALKALGVKVEPSCANFLLVDFGRDMTQAAARLREKRILVRTCASFGLGPGIWRLAVKTQEENARLIKCLREVLYAR